MFLVAALFFILGSVLGSFLGLIVDRMGRGEQIIRGRSKCDKCNHELAVLDLIPLLSYLILKGKCRYCGTKLAFRLFALELLTGLIFASFFIYATTTGIPPTLLILLLIIFFCLEGIFFTDLKFGVIPDEFNAIIAIATFVMLFVFARSILGVNLVVGLLACLFFLLIFAATRGRGMGFGDVKLSFVMGFFLGFPQIIVGLYAGFLTAAGVSLILIIARKKKLHGGTIAFGPFLVLGTVFAFFFTGSIISLFFN